MVIYYKTSNPHRRESALLGNDGYTEAVLDFLEEIKIEKVRTEGSAGSFPFVVIVVLPFFV